MVNEIRIYIEGGGEAHRGKSELRRGFSGFLRELQESARARRVHWSIIACGSRSETFRDFQNALDSHPEAFNVLLVDSEEPLYLANGPREHLRQRDHWSPPKINDDHYHLMVRMMEAWLVADVEALAHYYGEGFISNAIPKILNVEQIEKMTLETALKNATHKTQKGEYHKIKHGLELLTRIDVAKVRKAASHCDRLFQTLHDKLKG